MTAPFIQIVEVGPRDGLQNEPRQVSTADKLHLIGLLADAGLERIEAASFVSPKWVPQMADAAEVMAGVPRRAGLRYSVLVPNRAGLDRALVSAPDEIAVFASASEGFSKANLNANIAESLDRFRPVVAAARQAGVAVRGYVSCVTDCPFDGAVPPEAVADVAEALAAMGCGEISLGDTLGRGTPDRVAAMLGAVLAIRPPDRLAGHFHDTWGLALRNVDVALDHGLRVFDSSAGGLGGCPYAPGAAGNLATEALVAHLHARGWQTGVDPVALARAAAFARDLRGT